MIYGYNLFVFAYIYFYLHKKALINAAWYVSKLKKKKNLIKVPSKVVFHCLFILTSVSFLVSYRTNGGDILVRDIEGYANESLLLLLSLLKIPLSSFLHF